MIALERIVGISNDAFLVAIQQDIPLFVRQ
jgi:hypothetical protein